MVAGALDEGRIGGFEHQHAMLRQTHGILEPAAKDSGHGVGRCSDWPTPTLDQMSIGRPLREAAALETAKRHLMLPIGKATPKVKSEHLSDDDSIQVKQQGQGAKAQMPKEAGQSETGRRRDKATRRSVSAGVIMREGHCLKVWTKKQQVVALSSA